MAGQAAGVVVKVALIGSSEEKSVEGEFRNGGVHSTSHDLQGVIQPHPENVVGAFPIGCGS
jgi:hypothetical protein